MASHCVHRPFCSGRRGVPVRRCVKDEKVPEISNLRHFFALTVLTKATPGYAGGEKELIARGGVDKKKSPS